MVVPEIVPPGRSDRSLKGLTDATPFKPDLFDAIAALRVEDLRKFVAKQALKLRNRQFGPLFHTPAPALRIGYNALADLPIGSPTCISAP
jgi:hypothetical protein